MTMASAEGREIKNGKSSQSPLSTENSDSDDFRKSTNDYFYDLQP